LNISPTAFLVDKCQNIYTAGWGGRIRAQERLKRLTNNMPLKRDTVYGARNTSGFYLYVIDRDVDSLLYASFIAGSTSADHVDGGTSRFDKDGIIYHSVCASCGMSTNDFPTYSDHPTRGAYSTTDQSNPSTCNNALFKLDFEILINASFNADKQTLCLIPGELDSVVITNTSVGSTNTTWFFYGDTVLSAFLDTTIYFSQPGQYNIRQIVFDSICASDDFLDLKITVRPDNIILDPIYDTLICATSQGTINVRTKGFASIFKLSKSLNFSTPINSDLSDSIIVVNLSPGVNRFYVEGSNPITNACEKIDTIEITYVPLSASPSVLSDSLCENSPFQFNSIVQNIDTFSWNFGNGIPISSLKNPSVQFLSPGNYQIQFRYENNICQINDSTSLQVTLLENDLKFSIPDDTLYCGLGVFNLDASVSGSILGYQWSSSIQFLDTLNGDLNQSFIRLNSNDSSTYYLKISNKFCEAFDSITAEYIQYDLQLAPIIDSICAPYNLAVQSTIIGVDSFRIFSTNGFTTNSSPTPTIPFNTEGNYTVTLIGGNDRCMRDDTIRRNIKILREVIISSIPDTLICLGDTINLIGNSLGTAQQFTWDDSPNFSSPIPTINDSIIRINPVTNTIYFVKGETSICIAIDTVSVSIEELDIDVDDFKSFCILDTINLESFINVSSTPLSYIWAPNDSIISGQNTSRIEISPKSDLFYYLETTSATGCIDYDTVEVEVNLPAFSDAIILGADSLFRGQETQLSTNRNGSNLVYKWEPPDGIDNVNSPNPNVSLDSSKEYIVTITDLNTSCEVIARRRFLVFEINCAEPDIFIPTAFTPNGDQLNDILYVRGANLREIEFQLFNRWGELVFETNEINKGWNGTYQGKIVDPGVFVYQLKAICFDGQEYIGKGNITLIR
ncbi:MAG: gliding motility-associated C-terminal domain-containing protein, partial [Flavobacteriales bacterium]|nr:gliding motility-associated C-terminal domain-containing protein [Flavobacteriales bacterium]